MANCNKPHMKYNKFVNKNDTFACKSMKITKKNA